MIPLKQRNQHKPEEGIWGDCHRAAIASVLGLDLDEVPHFGDGGPTGEEFMRREQEFLRSRGLVRITVPYRGELEFVQEAVRVQNPGIFYLLGGRSRTGVDHSVVCLDGEIVHDPGLNDPGIIGPCDDGLYWLTFFGAGVAAAEGVKEYAK